MLDIFIRPEYRDVFLESIRYCQRYKGLEVYAYCIMSSHIHTIIARPGKQELQDVIRDIKKYTSSKIIEAVNNNPQERRRELLMWLFEKAGTFNPQMNGISSGNNIAIRFELNTNEKLNQRLDS
jgi:putative transposase